MSNKLITSYPGPDVDGIACIVAYEEFLEKSEEFLGAVFGEPDDEAKFLMEELGVTLPDAEESLSDSKEVILVDASFPDGISDEINMEQVTEIIDHRKNHEADKFPNAETEIELVGAAATLIARRFYREDKPISDESATLIYAAILDNTVNFQASVTTEEDRELAEWLEEHGADTELAKKVFEVKSDLDRSPDELVPDEYYNTNRGGHKIGVSQQEALEATSYIREHKEEIVEVLEKLRSKQNLDCVFLTSVDIQKGSNLIVAVDEETENLLSKALDVSFQNQVAEREDMLLRKEIMPKVKEELSD